MGKWLCKCGQRMTDHEYPDKSGYRVFSEELWDEVSGKTDENNKISWEELMEYSFDLYRCPVCGAFMVFGDEKTVTKYDFDIYERVPDEE